jgi:hypothetical protein
MLKRGMLFEAILVRGFEGQGKLPFGDRADRAHSMSAAEQNKKAQAQVRATTRPVPCRRDFQASIERDTDPTRLSPDNATMVIAMLCVDNQVE